MASDPHTRTRQAGFRGSRGFRVALDWGLFEGFFVVWPPAMDPTSHLIGFDQASTLLEVYTVPSCGLRQQIDSIASRS